MEHSQPRLTKREKRISRQNGDVQEGLTFKSQNFNLKKEDKKTPIKSKALGSVKSEGLKNVMSNFFDE